MSDFKRKLNQQKFAKLKEKLDSKNISMDLEFSKETIETLLFVHFLSIDEIVAYLRPN
jgi:hypothetical protein